MSYGVGPFSFTDGTCRALEIGKLYFIVYLRISSPLFPLFSYLGIIFWVHNLDVESVVQVSNFLIVSLFSSASGAIFLTFFFYLF